MRLSIQAFVKILMDKNWNKSQIANAIGVTPYQVYLYGKGVTTNPKAQICMNIYKNVPIDGQNIVIDIYKNYQELEQHYNIEVKSDRTMQR